MNKEIKLLTKMLNGTLKAMPKFLHQTIIQYQWQQAVQGALYLLASIGLAVLIFLTLRWMLKKQNGGYNLDCDFVFMFLIPMALIAFFIFTCISFSEGIDHIGNAISPVTSLIHSF